MSCGWDDISPRLLKVCRGELVKPLTHLINNPLYHGEFPDLLKITEILPVYKQRRETDMENYRPISSTSELGNIRETFYLLLLMGVHHTSEAAAQNVKMVTNPKHYMYYLSKPNYGHSTVFSENQLAFKMKNSNVSKIKMCDFRYIADKPKIFIKSLNK
ncbi:uncharacterized protein LOC126095370 [Schistocerca cancellata]|uniref:uncharacterized protein LOC126095370 n=1 Tax=Schistocerca cancellata TaxID=274614 RepID=UPI0021194A0B|nr:uncharacterized protein LOC126095370 [Schistocerca cancellata]